MQVPIANLLDRQWTSPSLQFSMLKNAIQCYISADDRSFNFSRSSRKVAIMQDVPLPSDVLPSFADVWTGPELLE